MATLQQLTPGMVFARDYRVLRPLAEGGMGAVYVAEQLSTGNRRALKLMHPQLVADARSRERFLMEARLGSQIGSAHVVEVAAAGVDDETGAPWLAMELLEGTDLSRVVAERGPVDPRTAHDLFEQLGDALGRAHALGIVHRDLKPENLFLASSRLKGVPFVLKVLDFGIAKIVAEHKTAATVTSAIGSPLWMAPEQANRGARVRPATDVWALGLIAFTLLTGKPYWVNANVPDEGFNLQALLVELMVDPLAPPSVRASQLGVGSALPQGFDAWFARCVNRDPDQRFADGAQAVGALLPLLTPQSAFPATVALHSTPGIAATAPVSSYTPVAPTTAMGTMAIPGMSLPSPPPAKPSRTAPILAGVALLGVGVAAGAVVLTRDPPAATSTTGAAPTTAVVRDEAPTPPPLPLSPQAPSPTPARATPLPAPTSPVAPTPEGASPEAPREGEISVRADPWCNVTLDGSPMGVTPLVLTARSGRHTVACTRGADTRTERVTVRANRREQITFSFTPNTASGNATNRAALPQQTPGAPRDIPESPPRVEIISALRAVSPDVRACGNGNGGVATVNIVFNSSGRVSSATLAAAPPNVQPSCVLSAVRRATISAFSRPTYSVTYPFALD